MMQGLNIRVISFEYNSNCGYETCSSGLLVNFREILTSACMQPALTYYA